MLAISLDKLDSLFAAISAKETLYIPVDNGVGGAAFRQYESGMQMTKKLKTTRSAKDFFFPQTENLVDFKVQKGKIEVIDSRSEAEDFVIFGVRACDAASFDILDRVFLSEPVDTYYQNRRAHGTVVTLACSRPAETCFCTAFGIDPAEPKGDASMWQVRDMLCFAANTEKGERLLESIAPLLSEVSEDFADVEKNNIRVYMNYLPLAKVSTEKFGGGKTAELFDSEKWATLSEACLGCGTCTFNCPTCQCYDIRDFETSNGVRRFRCWDSCMYSDFTKMASGNPRLTQKERFRQRFMHKLVYFPENNDGIFGCVGCGRCVEKCPVSTNIVKVMKELSEEKK